MTDFHSHSIKMEKGDEIALQYLAAAIAVEWDNLPSNSQDAILRQASWIMGLPFTTSLHEQIKSFIHRNKKVASDASWTPQISSLKAELRILRP